MPRKFSSSEATAGYHPLEGGDVFIDRHPLLHAGLAHHHRVPWPALELVALDLDWRVARHLLPGLAAVELGCRRVEAAHLGRFHPRHVQHGRWLALTGQVLCHVYQHRVEEFERLQDNTLDAGPIQLRQQGLSLLGRRHFDHARAVRVAHRRLPHGLKDGIPQPFGERTLRGQLMGQNQVVRAADHHRHPRPIGLPFARNPVRHGADVGLPDIARLLRQREEFLGAF